MGLRWKNRILCSEPAICLKKVYVESFLNPNKKKNISIFQDQFSDGENNVVLRAESGLLRRQDP